MLKGSGWRKGQECAHSWLKNHPLGFIGRGKVRAQILWPGMEARIRMNDGTLEAPSAQAVDVDGTYTDRGGILRLATANRLRVGQDGGDLEEIRTNKLQRSKGSGGGASTYPTNWNFSDAGMTTRVLSAADETDQFATELSIRRGRAVLTNDTGSQKQFNCLPQGSGEIAAVQNDVVTISGYIRAPEQTNVDNVTLFVNEFDSGPIFISGVGSADFKDELSTTKYKRFQLTHTMVEATAAFVGIAVIARLADGGSITLDVVLPQVETGATAAFASSPIPTDGGIVTRAADQFRFSNVGEAIALAANGMVLCKYTPGFNGQDNTTVSRIFSLGSTNDGVLLSDPGGGGTHGQFRYEVFSGGGITGNPTPDTLMVRDTTYRPVVTWELDSFRLSIDAVFKTQDTNGAAPTSGAQWIDADALNIGGLGSAGPVVKVQTVAHFVITEPVLSSRQIENADAVVRKAA